MDLVTLSRLQFGLTNIFHFLFVPLTLGLSAFVAFMDTRYYQTKDETYHLMTRFWGKLRTFIADALVGEGAVGRDELAFAKITDSPAEAFGFVGSVLRKRDAPAGARKPRRTKRS